VLFTGAAGWLAGGVIYSLNEAGYSMYGYLAPCLLAVAIYLPWRADCSRGKPAAAWGLPTGPGSCCPGCST
jgi:hypothetical protein